MRLHALISQEGSVFVAQCLEIEMASQGESADAAIVALREALALRLESRAAFDPRPNVIPTLREAMARLEICPLRQAP